MSIAEIHGKISDTGTNLSERMEDLLTADIVGCMRYLPAKKLLIPFLNTSHSHQGYSLSIPDHVLKVHYLFWPSIRIKGCTPCEPDVLLSIETTEGFHLIMIEAKYFSGLSSEADDSTQPNNQLARELDNLRFLFGSYISLPPEAKIQSRSLLFITQDMKIPEDLLAVSLAEYKKKRGQDADIYWTSWRFLPAILEQKLLLEDTPEHHAIMEDMLQLLQRKWLTMFTGVEPVSRAFDERDFEFFHISARQYRWPDLTIVELPHFKYRLPSRQFRWPDIPSIAIDYVYGEG